MSSPNQNYGDVYQYDFGGNVKVCDLCESAFLNSHPTLYALLSLASKDSIDVEKIITSKHKSSQY